jgi:PAS domain S-box-containing protein
MSRLHKLLPKGLYDQLAVVVTVILVATSLTYVFFISRQQAKDDHESMVHDSTVIVDTLASTCARLLVTNNYSELNTFLLESAKLPNIDSIHVVNPEGEFIASVIHPPDLSPFISHQPAKLAAPKSQAQQHNETDEHLLVLWRPIQDEKLLGQLKVDFSLKSDRDISIAIWKRTFLLTILWIFLSILLLMRIFKYPIAAIRQFSDFARQLNTLKGQQFPIDKSCLELEQLGRSINFASKELFQAEQKLSAEREQLSITLQSIGDSVISIDTTGTIMLFNKAAELITGWKAPQAIGKSIHEVFAQLHCDTAGTPSLAELVSDILKRGKAEANIGPYTLEPNDNLPKTTRTISLSGSPMYNSEADITGAVLICKDLTAQVTSAEEKISLEKQLQQAQKMEAIGTLAGGIAHDFNNILTPILGYAQLVEHQLPPKSELSNYQREVIKAANRAKELVQQILTFSRSADQQLLPLQIQIIVKEALKLLRSTIPTTIEINQDINPDCGYVLASPSQVHQIVMNLCTNAYQAMREKGGILTLSLQPIEISNQPDDSMLGGEYVLLQVTDTGSGISRLIIDKIFDPYFTSRPKGEGTGMGLSVVHGIVVGHNGYLNVQSIEGEGTTFQIYLPKVPKSTPGGVAAPDKQVLRGTEHILLVDDDAIIVGLESEMLRSLGYKVTSFTFSPEALEAFTEQPEAFDLVFTDMTMPKMTGIDLMRKIHTLRPEMPVVLCTGYSEIIDEKTALKFGVSAFITKPLALTTLGVQLRKILGARAA